MIQVRVSNSKLENCECALNHGSKHRQILVKGFGKERSKVQRAKVGGRRADSGGGVLGEGAAIKVSENDNYH